VRQFIKVLSQNPQCKTLHVLFVYCVSSLQDVEHIILGHIHLKVLLAEDVQPQVRKLKVMRGREQVQGVLRRHENVIAVDIAKQGYARLSWRGCVADLEHNAAFFRHERPEEGLKVGASGG